MQAVNADCACGDVQMVTGHSAVGITKAVRAGQTAIAPACAAHPMLSWKCASTHDIMGMLPLQGPRAARRMRTRTCRQRWLAWTAARW